MRAAAAILTSLVLLVLAVGPAAGQEIVSAEKFLEKMSETFAKVKDLEASIAYTQGKNGAWTGTLSYKSPLYLRIDFANPKGQVLAIDAEKLTLYVPSYDVVMVQKWKTRTDAQLLELTTAKGLSMLSGNFSVAYLTGASPVPLDEGSREQVVKLKLTPTTPSTGFKSLVLSVTKDYLYRRFEGIRYDGEVHTLDFTGLRINQNLPEARFKYDPPPYANVIDDLLFDSQE